ncbi:hypothetical protein BGZ54_005549, partial [Gamsiella multidivaricata]
HCVKSKKILVDAASEEQWSDFSSQVEEFLPLYGQLESYGLAEYLQGDPETTYASPELLQTLPLDPVWDRFHSIVMSAAYAHLPSVKTGGVPQPRRDEDRLQAKTSDLGYIIRSVRSAFIDQHVSDDALKNLTRREIHKWYAANGAELGLGPIPDANDNPARWEAWLETVKTTWRAARLAHREYLNAHRQMIINDHIDRRDINFEARTRQTIRSILEVSSGRIHLDHLVVENDDAGLYVTDDPTEIKQR